MLQAGFTRNHTLLFILFLTAVSYLFARRPTMSSPTTQTALIVSSIGGRITSTSSWPIPRPGPKQVQIRVTVAGLNPHDQKSRDAGLLIKDKLPAIIGNDIMGVVTAIGEQVTRFSVGDRVVSQSQLAYEQKALQQFAVLEEDFTAKIPHPFTDHDAATLPTNALAALISLFDPTSGLDIPAPWSSSSSRSSFDYAATTLLIVGGGSNCGRFGVQFAKMAGIGRIVVVGGEEEELKKWGATVVLDRHGGDAAVIHRIRQVVGDDLVYVFDAINLPEGQHVGISALSSSQRGKLARLRSSVGTVDETRIVGEKKAGYELKNVLGISQLKTHTVRPFWERLEGYLQDGSVVPLKYQVIDGLDADKVNELLDRYRDGKKVVQTHFRVSE